MFFRRKKKKDAAEEPAGGPEELRQRYRRAPGKNHALGILLKVPGGNAVSGDLIDVSAGGAAVRFAIERDPDLRVGQAVQLAFSSLLHGGEILVDVRVASVRGEDDWRRYGFEFQEVEELFRQLDSYYFNFFNRRRRMRVRPALDARLPLTIEWGGEELAQQVNDLSTLGLGFNANKATAARLEGVKEVEVHFPIPKTEHVIRTRAGIRHVTELSRGILFGLEFLDGDEQFAEQRAILRTYVKARESDMARWDSAYE